MGETVQGMKVKNTCDNTKYDAALKKSTRISSMFVRTAKTGFRKVGSAAKRLGSAAVRGLSSVSGALSSIQGLLVGGAIGMASREALSFDRAMTEVSTIVDTGAVNMERLGEQVKRLAVEMGKDPGDMAKGLYQAISAGVDAGKAMQFMRTAAKSATAGVATQTEAVDLLTNALNAYGWMVEQAGRVSDIAFKSVELGKTTFGELASTMGRVLPTAAQLNVAMEDTFAAVATLTKGGLNTEEAVTRVNAAMMAFLKPTNDMQEAMKGMGYASATEALKVEGFAGILGKIETAVGNDAETLAKLFPRVRAIGSVMALSGKSADEFRRILGELRQSAGATETAFAKVAESNAFKWDRMWSSIKVGAIDFGGSVLKVADETIQSLGGIELVLGNVLNVFEGFSLAVKVVVNLLRTAFHGVKAMVLGQVGIMTMALGGFIHGVEVAISGLMFKAADAMHYIPSLRDKAQSVQDAAVRVRAGGYGKSLMERGAGMMASGRESLGNAVASDQAVGAAFQTYGERASTNAFRAENRARYEAQGRGPATNVNLNLTVNNGAVGEVTDKQAQAIAEAVEKQIRRGRSPALAGG